MKKLNQTYVRSTLIMAFLVFTLITLGQAKKPTIMVVPSDVWCTQQGFMTTFDNQGTPVQIPDYKRAFQTSSDLLLVISKINGMMSERGFPLKNMESAIKTLEAQAAEDNMRSSKASGAAIAESPVDKLKAVAKADIIMQLTWTVNKTGPKQSVTFNLQGLDAYTDKQIASAAGTGAPSFASELPVLLEEAVLSHMDNFTNTLQTYFEDLFTNGREITIRIKTWEDWDEDLESEFGPDEEELGFLIEDWLAENVVNGRFNTTDATESRMLFEQVRIPLFYERNGQQRAMDTRRFARNLSKYLKDEPFNISNKVTTKGLGEASIILGSK